jgi:[acyl-carrier-protein] S-malonyltransferase
MFPGQASQYPEMLERACALFAGAARLVEAASAVLGRDLGAHYAAGNPHIFARNRDVQVGVFLVNHIYLVALTERGATAGASLGLSLGEYNHLVDIGALSFEEALRLVEARGTAYESASGGAMLSVQPIALADLQSVVDRARQHDCLVIANHNSATQFVLSGHQAAIDRAAALLDQEQFVHTVVLDAAQAMHSPLFAQVATRYAEAVQRARWQVPGRPYLPNVLGRFVCHPAGADLEDLLLRHITSPVLWQQSVELLARAWPEAAFIEVGPKGVLSNLVRRICPDHDVYKVDGPQGLDLLAHGAPSHA